MKTPDYRVTKVGDGEYRVAIDVLGIDGPFERTMTVTALVPDDEVLCLKGQFDFAAAHLLARTLEEAKCSS